MRDRVAAEIAAGRSLEQIQALRLADPYGRTTDFIPPEAFVASVYNSLQSPPHRHEGGTHRHGERG